MPNLQCIKIIFWKDGTNLTDKFNSNEINDIHV